MAPTVNPPNNACPKCGDNSWRGPSYVPPTIVQGRGEPKTMPESLAWTCTCGFVINKKTADAP